MANYWFNINYISIILKTTILIQNYLITEYLINFVGNCYIQLDPSELHECDHCQNNENPVSIDEKEIKMEEQRKKEKRMEGFKNILSNDPLIKEESLETKPPYYK